jgi:TRAP transporter TAXI family solute receptor
MALSTENRPPQPKLPAPRIARSVTLNFRGDWGRANLHRALGWLCYELVRLSGPHTKIGIWNGRGALDNIQAVGRGEVDVALATPAGFAAMAVAGLGPCAQEPFPHLRALGHVPQHDRLVLAIRKELGIRSFAELREKKPALRITAGVDDGTAFMGMAAQAMMNASGMPRATIESWGGRYVEFEEPRECTRAMLDGKADAIIQEAIMTNYWTELADTVDLVYLPIEPAAKARLNQELGWTTATLPKDYLRGMDRDMEFLDFSHFLLLTTTDLPDDIAFALAWASIEQFHVLEQQYRHIPPERSPVSYPIDPKLAARTPIPLHPGAARYYKEAGHL